MTLSIMEIYIFLHRLDLYGNLKISLIPKFFTHNQLFTDWIDHISDGINDKFISFGIALSVYFSKDAINYKKEKKQFINILKNLDSDFDGITDHNDDCQKTPKNIESFK